MNKIAELMMYRDPQGPNAPDTDEFESLLYISIHEDKFDLINAIIGARYFGMKIIPDERTGRRLENIPPDYLQQYHKIFMKHIDLIRKSLRYIANNKDK